MKLILCIIAAEAMTQLTCKAEIFNRLRDWLKSLSKFTDELLSCPYCVSVWVAGFTVLLAITWEWSFWFVYLLVIHRMSNFLHDLIRIVLNFKIDQILRR
jgi:hypothetical protein